MSSRTISVIGTAGRGETGARVTRDLYDAMYAEVRSTAMEWGVDSAVSGGAAVADHLAVRGFLEGVFSRLTLFLPARFEAGRFIPNPDIRFNPGRTLTHYHETFSTACSLDSLAELRQAIEKGARVEVREGFHRRNLEVAAACSHMIALTFGTDLAFSNDTVTGAGHSGDFLDRHEGFRLHTAAGLCDGGTAHTWDACWKADIKRHVNLTFLERSLSLQSASPQP